MKALWIAVLALAPVVASAQQFCRVDNVGNQTCVYGTLNACRSAVAALGGACALQQPTSQPSRIYDVNSAINKPDMAESARQGYEFGLRMRQAKQASEANTSPAPRRLEVNGRVVGYWVMYKCPKGDGWEYTGTPASGCIVEYVTFY